MRPLGLSYPADAYSLSHIALPFPTTDGLYGAKPDPSENFGVRLGTVVPRGERNVLIVSLDSLMRLSSNPFFPYLARRIEEGLPAKSPPFGTAEMNRSRHSPPALAKKKEAGHIRAWSARQA